MVILSRLLLQANLATSFFLSYFIRLWFLYSVHFPGFRPVFMAVYYKPYNWFELYYPFMPLRSCMHCYLTHYLFVIQITNFVFPPTIPRRQLSYLFILVVIWIWLFRDSWSSSGGSLHTHVRFTSLINQYSFFSFYYFLE